MVFCDAGSEITLEVGVSSRNLPSLDFHMRDADCDGAPSPAGCVLVVQSEQDGGVGGGVENWPTAAISVARKPGFCAPAKRSLKLLTHRSLPPTIPTYRYLALV